MIPREGELLDLNMTATYDGPGDDGEVPTIMIGGIRVSAYVDSHGVFRVSVATDEDDIDERIWRGRGEPDAIAMSIDVNSTRVYHA